ncbi:MAG: DNA repair protein RecO [Deltaproteobacteria bacterium]|nr:DNA repair protein RecO [Deltaproteobacteria bacterium]MBW2069951.1 DNA repair protein RecO [Deltaproteobacteria bacterium]
MIIRRSRSIILRTTDYGESDRLITFFSRRTGLLKGIAKGARRSKKRFVHSLEPLCYASITYAERSASGLVRIDASELRNPFTSLRADIERLGYGSLGCEVILGIAPERQANPPLFDLLLQYLLQLEKGRDPESISLLFQIRVLSLSGFAPNLQGCIQCHRQPDAAAGWSFSVAAGSLCCPEHSRSTDSYAVSLGTILLLRQAQLFPVARMWRLRFHPRSREECRPLLIDLLRHHLEKDLKSLKLLRQIGALPQATSLT